MMNALRWAVFALVALAINAPVIATLVTSFKSPREIATNPSLWIEAPTLANYAAVLTVSDRLNIFALLGNSLAVSLIGSGLALLLALPASYAIARGGFGRDTLLPLVVNLRAVPLIIFAIPIYMGFQWLGLLDTRLGLGLILTIVNLPLALVILVNALADLPEELDEAARLDGAESWQILLLILDAAHAAGPDDGVHLRLHHRLERVPVRSDAHHARRGPGDRRRVVLLRERRRRRAMGSGRGGDDPRRPASDAARARHVPPDRPLDARRRGEGLNSLMAEAIDRPVEIFSSADAAGRVIVISRQSGHDPGRLLMRHGAG